MQKGKHILKIFVIGIIAIALYALVMAPKPKNTTPNEASHTPALDLATISLFTNGLAANGISADTIGFHSFSSDGNFFVFSAFKNGATPANQAYLLNLKTQELTQLPGLLERGFTDPRILQLYSSSGTILYWPQTKTQKTYQLGDTVFAGALSPDGKTYIVNTLHGIKKIDLTTDTVTALSTNTYDGAFAWFSDNTRVIGYKESGENLYEAGKGRSIGIWNVSNGTFQALPNFTQKNIRMMEWITPDEIVRVNTGYDDGSHDYIYTLANNTLTDIGETSDALMGGLIVDQSRHYFAVIGQAQSGSNPHITLYAGDKKVADGTIEPGFFRESGAIIDQDHLLYIRKKTSSTGNEAPALVEYSFSGGVETLIRDLPKSSVVALSLAPDHKSWVVSTDATFIVGTL